MPSRPATSSPPPAEPTPAAPPRAELTRRSLLQSAGGAVSLAAVGAEAQASSRKGPSAAAFEASLPNVSKVRPVVLRINGRAYNLNLEPRVTLLDALREYANLPGSKKGCDRGQCGACTVLIDGRRVNSCLTLAVMQEGSDITTIEGLGTPDALHPMQAAFIENDAFQCGYCTPGQICSAVSLVNEYRAGQVSAATRDVRAPLAALSDDEIRERMSGNLCRCGAYPNIVAAIRSVAQTRGAVLAPASPPDGAAPAERGTS